MTTTARSVYRGRFAPSPSGPLHLGSLFTAVASYLDARAHGGQWQLRFDDLDTPRVAKGAVDQILRSLECHGLHWDGPVTYQSAAVARYRQALEQLRQSGQLYWCRCSRRERGTGPYPGYCREHRSPRPDSAIRFASRAAPWPFEDRVQGQTLFPIQSYSGDYIVWRRDGICGYPLATALDDGDPAMTHVVRGTDLLTQTPPQLELMAALKLSAPRYAHVPVLTDATGQKLSKQQGATALDDQAPGHNLLRVLALLGINLDAHSAQTPESLLNAATEEWSPETLEGIERLPVDPQGT